MVYTQIEDELAQIERNIFDYSDESNIDIKIKPNFYLHMAILSAQKTLLFSVAKTSIADGLLGYNVFIEHIEVICKAAKFLDDNYNDELEKFKQTDEYINTERKDVQMVKLANKKLELLLSKIFQHSPVTFPLQTTEKRKIEKKIEEPKKEEIKIEKDEEKI